jgi:hypothetical protein
MRALLDAAASIPSASALGAFWVRLALRGEASTTNDCKVGNERGALIALGPLSAHLGHSAAKACFSKAAITSERP